MNHHLEEDMELSERYDLAIKESLNNKPINGVYYDENYKLSLIKSMTDEEKKRFKGEYEKDYGDNRWKMCSVASSSRLCYLYFKYNNKKYENPEFEVVLHNNGCNPHLDALVDGCYCECKCHEIVGHHSVYMSKKTYESLLKQIFNVDLKPDDIHGDNIKLRFNMFKGLDVKKEYTCGKYFDFKQFICHIIGILGIEKPTTYVGLQYVFFVPDDDQIEKQKLIGWRNSFEEMIAHLFPKLRNIKLSSGATIGSCIDIKDPKFIKVSSLVDPFRE